MTIDPPDAATSLARHADALRATHPLRDAIDTARVGRYRGYAEVVAAWQSAAERGARVRAIGASVRGEPLFALEVGAPDAAAVVAVMAGLHAMEWIGVETLLALLDRLLDAPPRDVKVLLFPAVNVDGYRAVEDDLRAGRRRFRRGNAHGVDLNRNWPTFFRRDNVSARLLPSVFDPGTAPLSEPEVHAVVSALEAELARGAHLARALSLHSFGRAILYPFGGRWRPPVAAPSLRWSAAAMAAQLPEPYVVRQSCRWVLPGAFAHGMEIDHLFVAYGAVALLVECSAGGLSLRDPSSWLHPFRWFNPRDPARVAAGLAPALDDFVRTGCRGRLAQKLAQ